MARLRSRWVAFAALTPLLVGFDLWSKRAAVDALAAASELPVQAPWLSFVHAENPGAMFSSPVPLPVIVVAGVVGIGGVLSWLRGARTAPRRTTVAAALVTGGALGNLLDRVGDGTVTDFIRVSVHDTGWGPWCVQTFGTATWPIFNLADVWLVVGVAGLVALQLREGTSAPAGDPAPQ